MDKTRKKKIKQYIAWGCAAAVVLGLAVIPMLVSSAEEASGYTATIKTGTVTQGTISTALTGGGTLTEESEVTVSIPSGVLLEEFTAGNGDFVSAGDTLAKADRVSIMTAIAQVQQALEYLSEQITEAAEQEGSDKIKSQTDGMVKLVYAQEGDRVQDVVLEHGALAVLSLDGRMAVKFQSETALAVGDTLQVILADGTVTDGRVESSLVGTVVVTIADEGYDAGQQVSIALDDVHSGSGELYIHDPWNAVAYYGTVGDIKVKENESVSAGQTLFVLEDTDYTAQYQALCAQRQEYEAVMLELFRLYQTLTVTAPCDGVVSGVDTDSASLLSADPGAWSLTFLVNAPNGDDETVYSNYVGVVSAAGTNGWAMSMDPQELTITDYKDLSAVTVQPEAMTEVAIFTPQVPIYELVENEWQQLEPAAITAGDTLLFAMNADAGFVWVVRIARAQTETTPDTPTTPTTPSRPSGGSQGSFSGMAGYPSGGQQQEEAQIELYDLTKTTILSVTPQDTVTFTITVDELDIGSISLGQKAAVSVTALDLLGLEGIVTEIGDASTGSGNSKFPVTITLPRSEGMLSGMSACADLSVQTLENVLTISAAALNDDSSQVFVYTGWDKGSDTLTGPVPVTTGISDGETVQILSGLEAGAVYYYTYYDSPDLY